MGASIQNTLNSYQKGSSLVVTDTFSFTEDPIWNNANWNEGDGTISCGDGYAWCKSSDPSMAYYDGTFNANQYSQVVIYDVPDNGYYIGCAVRVSLTNGYGLIVDLNDYILFSLISGVYNVITSGANTFTTNDIVKLTVSGSTLKMYKNSVQFGGDQTDGNISSGSVGVAGMGWDVLTGATSFEGGNL